MLFDTGSWNMSQEGIRLFGRSPVVEILRRDVYFPFADGRFSYDCVACGAQCCAGHGYHMTSSREIEAQLDARPALRFFIEPIHPERGTNYSLGNCPPACFFLDEHRLCGVQKATGYSSKPETCRLFPFNSLRRYAGFVVVAPHTSLCPLNVVPTSEKSGCSRHDVLFEEMRMGGVGVRLPEVTRCDVVPESLVSLERAIVAETERHLAASDYAAFACEQLRLTSRLLGGAEGDVDAGETFAKVVRFRAMIHGLLVGRPRPPSIDPELTRTIVAVTPIVRANALFHLKEFDEIGRIGPERLPYMLLTLFEVALLARASGMRLVTYQTLMRLLKSYQSTFAVLAWADREMTWRPDVVIPWPLVSDREGERRYLNVVRALLPAVQAKNPQSLGQILLQQIGDDETRRTPLLKSLVQRLSGRITPRGEAVSAGRNGAKAFVQRMILRHAGADLVLTAAQRIAASKG